MLGVFSVSLSLTLSFRLMIVGRRRGKGKRWAHWNMKAFGITTIMKVLKRNSISWLKAHCERLHSTFFSTLRRKVANFLCHEAGKTFTKQRRRGSRMLIVKPTMTIFLNRPTIESLLFRVFSSRTLDKAVWMVMTLNYTFMFELRCKNVLSKVLKNSRHAFLREHHNHVANVMQSVEGRKIFLQKLNSLYGCIISSLTIMTQESRLNANISNERQRKSFVIFEVFLKFPEIIFHSLPRRTANKQSRECCWWWLIKEKE